MSGRGNGYEASGSLFYSQCNAVRIACLRHLTYKPGLWLIDWMTPEQHKANCRLALYELGWTLASHWDWFEVRTVWHSATEEGRLSQDFDVCEGQETLRKEACELLSPTGQLGRAALRSGSAWINNGNDGHASLPCSQQALCHGRQQWFQIIIALRPCGMLIFMSNIVRAPWVAWEVLSVYVVCMCVFGETTLLNKWSGHVATLVLALGQ